MKMHLKLSLLMGLALLAPKAEAEISLKKHVIPALAICNTIAQFHNIYKIFTNRNVANKNEFFIKNVITTALPVAIAYYIYKS